MSGECSLGHGSRSLKTLGLTYLAILIGIVANFFQHLLSRTPDVPSPGGQSQQPLELLTLAGRTPRPEWVGRHFLELWHHHERQLRHIPAPTNIFMIKRLACIQ